MFWCSVKTYARIWREDGRITLKCASKNLGVKYMFDHKLHCGFCQLNSQESRISWIFLSGCWLLKKDSVPWSYLFYFRIGYFIEPTGLWAGTDWFSLRCACEGDMNHKETYKDGGMLLLHTKKKKKRKVRAYTLCIIYTHLYACIYSFEIRGMRG